MKTASKLLVMLLLGSLVMVGCEKVTPEQREARAQQEQERAYKQDYQVVKLFTKDGCTVYKFRDSGDRHYFTNCNGSTSTQQDCGKHCTKEEEISTEAE